MTTTKLKSMCERAQTYYYEYLQGQGQERIPTEVAAHIDKCRFCRGKLDRVKILVAELERQIAESPVQSNSAAVTNLGLHFAYIGALVSCKTARPFLPNLAEAALKFSVPTPITVHLDKCQQCANDLESIQPLNLSHKQLCRLGELFTEEPGVNAEVCKKAQSVIERVGAMNFEGVSAEILRHLCVCPDCRKLLYKARETRREQLTGDIEQPAIPCEAISATDIFDYVVPYGINPGEDRYAMFRQSLMLHLSNCPKCLGKMQALHNTVYGIAERQESKVVTCFKLEESKRDDTADMHKDWPIKVEVFSKSRLVPTATDPGGFEMRVKQKVSALNLKQFVKPVAAAAAILIVAWLFFTCPAAKAVDLGQIYKALEQIKNVYFIAFVPEKTKPTQEIWVSQALDIKMSKTETQWVLRDIKGKSQKTRDLNTNLIETAELNADTLGKVRRAMEAPWGLLPFDNASAVPKDAKWQQVADEEIGILIANTKVYDLVWMERTLSGSVVYNKWRGYIDVETKLPKRIEWWQKCTEEEYELATVIEVAYPTTAEIRAIIEEGGF